MYCSSRLCAWRRSRPGYCQWVSPALGARRSRIGRPETGVPARRRARGEGAGRARVRNHTAFRTEQAPLPPAALPPRPGPDPRLRAAPRRRLRPGRRLGRGGGAGGCPARPAPCWALLASMEGALPDSEADGSDVRLQTAQPRKSTTMLPTARPPCRAWSRSRAYPCLVC